MSSTKADEIGNEPCGIKHIEERGERGDSQRTQHLPLLPPAEFEGGWSGWLRPAATDDGEVGLLEDIGSEPKGRPERLGHSWI